MEIENSLTVSRKERERLARRQEILDAARKVFSERGFEKATLDEIAEAAEYGKGTIYNYFKNKEELFCCIMERGIERFQKFVECAIQNKKTPREKLETYIDAAFEFFEKYRQIFSIMETERNNLVRRLDGEMYRSSLKYQEKLVRFLADLLEKGIKKRDFKNLHPIKTAHLLFGLIHVAFVHAIRTPEHIDLKSDAQLIKKIFFSGVTLKSQ
ncbi:MAG: TetR/AcrR family transcriptional regulator [bacterium]